MVRLRCLAMVSFNTPRGKFGGAGSHNSEPSRAEPTKPIKYSGSAENFDLEPSRERGNDHELLALCVGFHTVSPHEDFDFLSVEVDVPC